MVQRAKVIVGILDNPKLLATQSGFIAGFQSRQMGVTWIKRFNEKEEAGLEAKPKTGRPPTHDQKGRSALISLALGGFGVQIRPDNLAI